LFVSRRFSSMGILRIKIAIFLVLEQEGLGQLLNFCALVETHFTTDRKTLCQEHPQ